jgi:hypothetical protein
VTLRFGKGDRWVSGFDPGERGQGHPGYKTSHETVTPDSGLRTRQPWGECAAPA